VDVKGDEGKVSYQWEKISGPKKYKILMPTAKRRKLAI
jgi:hypothetical protein